MNKENNQGFIYCLHNPTFKYYGDNVYKLGKTNNLKSRLAAYTTGYVEKSEYILYSSILNDKDLGEKLLFKELDEYRINNNREFFKCDINIIKTAFNNIEKYFNQNKQIINNKVLDCINNIKPDIEKSKNIII
jgi:hypothetical protein